MNLMIFDKKDDDNDDDDIDKWQWHRYTETTAS